MNELLNILQIKSPITSTHLLSINPTTGEPIHSVDTTPKENYESIISSAQQAFLNWRMKPAPYRGEIIRQIGDALRKQKMTLGKLIALESGKPLQEGLGEVQEMIDMADFAVGQSRMLYGLSMHSERPMHRMYEQWHPLGIVGVITAFNFPVAVWAWNAFIAAVCGNTIIWKPSPKTPLSAIAIQYICEEVTHRHQLKSIFSLIITDDLELSEKLVDDKRLSLISFTGSTKVGRMINEKVSSRLGKVLLEMSGNNAVILDETAHLKLAIPAIVFGAIGTNGQRCTTTRRLFIHEKIYENVIDKLKNIYKELQIGDPLDENTHIGPLIDEEAVIAFTAAIAEIKYMGGEILFGGKKLNRTGFFVEPTLATAENHWNIVQNETFAPILYVMKFKTLEEAIELQNAVPQGLSSALFTENLKNAELFLSACGSDCGIANINIGTSGAEIGGGFGGEKDTGGGREAGSDAWKTYMRRQTVTINWSEELPFAQGIQFEI